MYGLEYYCIFYVSPWETLFLLSSLRMFAFPKFQKRIVKTRPKRRIKFPRRKKFYCSPYFFGALFVFVLRELFQTGSNVLHAPTIMCR